MPSGLKSEMDRVELVNDCYSEAEEALQAENERIKENFRFYCGGDGQWDTDTLVTLDAEGRPHLSVNKCLPTINLISGYQRKFRQACQVLARRGGNAQIAEILTRLVRHAMDLSRPKGDFALSYTFMMGAIGAKWWTGLDVDRSWDLVHGDILPRTISCFDMLEDPLYKGYDVNANDVYDYCRYIVRSRWLTVEQLGLLWPDKKDELELYQGKMNEWAPSGGQVRIGSQTTTAAALDDYGAESDSMERGRTRTVRWRVKECWYKQYKRETFLVMPSAGRIWDMSAKRGAARKLAGESEGRLELYERVAPELHQIVTLGELHLDYQENPLGELALFPFERFCPYWVDGMPLGILDNIKDSQRELNKRRSQMLHHLNSSANSGWDIPENSVTEEMQRKMDAEGSRPGFNLVYDPRVGQPTRRTPAPLSEAHAKLASWADNDINTITGFNDAMRGYGDRGKESGEALKTRRDQGLTIGEPVFDNFAAMQLGFYQTLVELIRQRDESGEGFYSDDEIAMIIEEDQLNVDLELMRSSHLGRYGLSISTAQTSPTVRNQSFGELKEMLTRLPSLAAEVDPVEVLDLSDIAGKERIIEAVKMRRQQMQQQQQEMMAAQAQQQGALAAG